MAFCTNCGKSLEEGVRFCTNCGTPAQTAAPAPATAPTVPVAAAAPVAERAVTPHIVQQPATATSETAIQDVQAPELATYDAPLTAPQASTSPVFVIVCVVLLVLIAGGIAGTVYLQQQGKAKNAVQQTSAETSQPSETPSSIASASGSESSPATSAPRPATSAPTATTSTPVPRPAPSTTPVADSIRVMNLGNYPGATPVAIATLTGETVVAGFLTRDTPQQVMQFYKVRFPVSTASDSTGKTELSATLPGGERIRIQAQSQGTNTQVMILQEK